MRSRLPFNLKTLKLAGPLLLLGLTSCTLTQAQVPPRNIPIHQNWVLQPGSKVGDFSVVGSLGDVSIDLDGHKIKAPFDGQVQPAEHDCIAFTSPEIPAYLFRLCGVTRPRLGDVKAGTVIGRGDVLQFAAMRRQPDGTWAMVEPAIDVLEKTFAK
ncbi:MAG: hypothetical protein AAF773_25975 [Cyanobacteria bacterium P01_D01_bin.115]